MSKYMTKLASGRLLIITSHSSSRVTMSDGQNIPVLLTEAGMLVAHDYRSTKELREAIASAARRSRTDLLKVTRLHWKEIP